MDRKQVIVIHGGETFKTYDDYLSWLRAKELDLEKMRGRRWKSSLEEDLGDEYDVIAPSMPNGYNAKYVEWRIWFEKFFPYVSDDVILIGHSLGGIFLAKYLAENRMPVRVRAAFLVAAPFDATGTDYTLADFILPESLNLLASQCGDVFFYFSSDDAVVPPANLEKYKEAVPSAHFSLFNDRGHFQQERFPELIADIRNL